MDWEDSWDAIQVETDLIEFGTRVAWALEFENFGVYARDTFVSQTTGG